MKVTFSRSSSWTSGWRGRANVTDVFVNGGKVGEIRGNEGSFGSMDYRIALTNRYAYEAHADSLKQAKEMIRKLSKDWS